MKTSPIVGRGSSRVRQTPNAPGCIAIRRAGGVFCTVLSRGAAKIVLLGAVGTLASSALVGSAAVISPERLASWSGNVGVPGGIPKRTTIFVNVATTSVTKYRCFGDGVTDNLTAIQNAINDCPVGQVVYVPAGTYRVSGQIRIYYRNNWTLRGDGPGKTIFTGGGGSMFALGQAPWINEWPATTAITGGATAGSTSITVASTASLQNGQMMFLEQDNDGTNVFGFGSGGTGTPTANADDRLHDNTAVFNHRVMVTNITGNTVSFIPPLPFDFNPALNPRAVGFGSIVGLQYVGLEDLTINGSSTGQGVWFQGMFGSWLKNVELTGWGTFGFKFDYVACVSVVDCYIHEPAGFNWSRGYPLQFDMANNCLVQNNIFYKYQDGLMVQGGCGANVIAYNLFFREYNSYLGTQNMLASLYGNHTAYPQFNLWEGNYGNGVQLDFYYGPSRTATFLRNYLTGADPEITTGRVVMKLDSHQWSNNVVGNILGSSGTAPALYAMLPKQTINWVQTFPVTWTYDSGTANFSYSQATIFRLGYPYSGNNSSAGAANPPTTGQLNYIDLSVKSNTLIHGNWDAANNAVTWDANIADHSIPSSYYLPAKPDWFGSLNWPPFESTNGSLMTVMSLTNLPAGYRFVHGVNPPAAASALNLAPVAVAFAKTATTGAAPFAVLFSSNGSSDPEGTSLSYIWNFGDGATTVSASPSHTFTNSGTFDVHLIVSDGTNSTISSNVTIKVSATTSTAPWFCTARAECWPAMMKSRSFTTVLSRPENGNFLSLSRSGTEHALVRSCCVKAVDCAGANVPGTAQFIGAGCETVSMNVTRIAST